MNSVDVKKAINELLAFGVTRVRIAKMFGTNEKTLKAIMDAPIGSYKLFKVDPSIVMGAGA